MRSWITYKVRSILFNKKILKYSYKKEHRILRKLESKERIRDFCEAAYIQHYLQSNWYHYIFADEFHLSF